ncbi:hypothetical protein EDEG_04024 [Edhazardia aedis USNM 41457]|uniref:Uncharacterized protein n=1 Tax=Edhazardia aedis (strain USNM 41457) TaxID=1003232 RepID=J9D161_EDHAE|nr:hypothetical protein EDEG_04024 [Edhazardia aedis USNM 41457]|eukprot:EJW01319.1 hypothetical protein EDEG_04024 [Edhazardia aedis USNM 41457]
MLSFRLVTMFFFDFSNSFRVHLNFDGRTLLNGSEEDEDFALDTYQSDEESSDASIVSQSAEETPEPHAAIQNDSDSFKLTGAKKVEENPVAAQISELSTTGECSKKQHTTGKNDSSGAGSSQDLNEKNSNMFKYVQGFLNEYCKNKQDCKKYRPLKSKKVVHKNSNCLAKERIPNITIKSWMNLKKYLLELINFYVNPRKNIIIDLAVLTYDLNIELQSTETAGAIESDRKVVEILVSAIDYIMHLLPEVAENESISVLFSKIELIKKNILPKSSENNKNMTINEKKEKLIECMDNFQMKSYPEKHNILLERLKSCIDSILDSLTKKLLAEKRKVDKNNIISRLNVLLKSMVGKTTYIKNEDQLKKISELIYKTHEKLKVVGKENDLLFAFEKIHEILIFKKKTKNSSENTAVLVENFKTMLERFEFFCSSLELFDLITDLNKEMASMFDGVSNRIQAIYNHIVLQFYDLQSNLYKNCSCARMEVSCLLESPSCSRNELIDFKNDIKRYITEKKDSNKLE